ncbi:hypothetical protein PR001_g29983, partial [Phytophthora rubi]
MGGRPRVNTTITGTSPRNASCARPGARFVVGGGVHGVGGGAEAKEVKLPLPRSSGGEDGGGAEAKEAKLPLPRSSGGEDGGGAEAKEAKLPLPRSRFVAVVACIACME